MLLSGRAFVLRTGLLLLSCIIVWAETEAADFCPDSQELTPRVSLLQTSLEFRPSAGATSTDAHVHKLPEVDAHGIAQQAALDSGRRLLLDEVSVLHRILEHSMFGFNVWLLLGVAVLVGSVVVSFTWDDGMLDMETNAEYLLTSKADLKKDMPSRYMQMFLAHRNSAFGKFSEHSFRGACIFGLYAIPFFLPPGICPPMDHAMKLGIYSNFIGQQILFNFQATVGGTMQTGAETTSGTFLAVLTIWLMLGFYPQGVASGDTHIYVVGICSGSFLVLCMLWLNFPLKVTIFCLARFSQYFMDFLNPTADVASHYSVGFTINFTGTAMKAFMATFVGTCLAMIANLVPFPVLSLREAENECCTAIGLLKEAWLDFIDFSNQPKKRLDMMNKMQRELFQVKKHIDTCNTQIGLAWWECLGFGPRQRTRARLTAVNNTTQDMYMDLLGALQCSTCDDTFSPQHQEMMAQLGSVNRLIECCGEMMFLASKSTASSQHIKELASCVKATNDAISTFTKDFLKSKQKLRVPEVDQEFLEEYVFARSACIYGRMCCDLAFVLTEDAKGNDAADQDSPGPARGKKLTTSYNGPVVLDVFNLKAITNTDHVLVASRLSITYLLVFLIGYFGRKDIITEYSAGIVTTFALLISPGHGVQLTKNLMRLQGVVLGTAIGLLVHAFVATCGWTHCFMSTAFIIVWIWLCKIGHEQTREYSYLCFLLALFGQNELVVQCSSKGYDPAHADFKLVFSVVAAIATMVSVDMLTPTRPASTQAAETIQEAWSRLTAFFAEVSQGNSAPDLNKHHGETLAVIMRAGAIGKEASTEPRFWKTPWRDHSFQACISTLRLIRSSLYAVLNSLPREGSPRHADDQVVQKILQMPEFQAIIAAVQKKMAGQQRLMKIFSHEYSTQLPELNKATSVLIDKEIEDNILAFCKAACRQKFPQDMVNDESPSLEWHAGARVAHIVASFDSMRAAMEKFQSTVVIQG